MAALEYKLEYFKGAQGAATDEGVYIHLRTDPPGYQTIISKETYWSGENEINRTALVNRLFDVPGVVRLSLQAWRVYVEKSPVFKWEEVTPNVLTILVDATGASGTTELPGSGLVLTGDKDRRSF